MSWWNAIQPLPRKLPTDPQAIKEAIWAVLRNALDAAATSIQVQLDRNDECVTLTISDDGPGLSDRALAFAFHPYFSGREAGRDLALDSAKLAASPSYRAVA